MTAEKFILILYTGKLNTIVDYWYCDGVGILSDQLKHSLWTQIFF